MFSEEVSTHISAYFASREGGTINYMKLIKLMYLADRQSMAETGTSISGDTPYSLPLGPVLSKTLKLFQNKVSGDTFDGFFDRSPAHCLTLKCEVSDKDDIDSLSSYDLSILAKTYAEFGAMSEFELVDYTHDNCAEWVDPQGSSSPINIKDLFVAVGKGEESAEAMRSNYFEQEQLERVYATLR